jgi:hypothetical protein
MQNASATVAAAMFADLSLAELGLIAEAALIASVIGGAPAAPPWRSPRSRGD